MSPKISEKYVIDKHPGIIKEKLHYKYKVSTQDLDTCFVSEIVIHVNRIYQDLRPKYIFSSVVSGMAFARFTMEFAERSNGPDNNIQFSTPDKHSW
ncbi:hypothetical protein Glove_29g191 [Diversispora epigaea]|uniref:Uncharacterized protein n=1 Tax=Diversispora epigaea TaxID=1348612 RepID=A0A397JJS1_9GLOM|nr:hypothetical protein Glove_29g191 [Diversispora epigaea]